MKLKIWLRLQLYVSTTNLVQVCYMKINFNIYIDERMNSFVFLLFFSKLNFIYLKFYFIFFFQVIYLQFKFLFSIRNFSAHFHTNFSPPFFFLLILKFKTLKNFAHILHFNNLSAEFKILIKQNYFFN